jgi:hypothetical protein
VSIGRFRRPSVAEILLFIVGSAPAPQKPGSQPWSGPMHRQKSLFRQVLEQMIEGRQQSARRYVEAYLRTHDLRRPNERS